MKIVAAIPTRGVVVTETIGSVIKELSTVADDWGIALTSQMPLPECHNAAVKQALDDGADYVLLVEEDVVLPQGTVKELLKADGDIVAADVPSRHVEGLTQIGRYKKEIHWVHTGCTLIKKEVFDKLEEPWFDNKVAYDFKLEAGDVTFTKRELSEPLDYGGQDIHFCQRAKNKGFTIKAVPIVCTHIVVEFDSKREHVHKIRRLSKITRDNAFRP